ncbi:hypothetical protein IFR05_005424 [Cadophora sp. M221]|nr:hypothetical protein IFR05_005424 [Cadophora sp. M221]
MSSPESHGQGDITDQHPAADTHLYYNSSQARQQIYPPLVGPGNTSSTDNHLPGHSNENMAQHPVSGYSNNTTSGYTGGMQSSFVLRTPQETNRATESIKISDIAAPKALEAPATLARAADPPSPLTKFTIFPQLPLELRNLIWAEAAYVLRNVDIHFSTDKSRFFSTSSIPTILHATPESRAEGLKYYKATFGRVTIISEEDKDGNVSISSSEEDEVVVLGCALEPRVYVNWAVDTICVMSLHPSTFGVSEILDHAEGKPDEDSENSADGEENEENDDDEDDEGSEGSEDFEDFENYEYVEDYENSDDDEDGEDGAEWATALMEIAPALEEFSYHRHTINANLQRSSFRMDLNLEKGLHINPEETANFIEYWQVAQSIDDEIRKNRGWRFVDKDEDGTNCDARKVARKKKKTVDGAGEGGIPTNVAVPRVKTEIERAISIKLRELNLIVSG